MAAVEHTLKEMNPHVIFNTIISSCYFCTGKCSCFCAVAEQAASEWKIRFLKVGVGSGVGAAASARVCSVNGDLHAGNFGTLHAVLHTLILDHDLQPNIFTGFLSMVRWV